MKAIRPLIGAMAQVESNNNPDAVSPRGALGRMQVMPATARQPGYGIKPAVNFSDKELTRVGQEYIQKMINKYDGDVNKALMAYNWGPGNTDKWLRAGANPNKVPKETRDYVKKVNKTLSGGKGKMVTKEQFQAQIKQLTKLRDTALGSRSKAKYQQRLDKAKRGLKNLRSVAPSVGKTKAAAIAANARKAERIRNKKRQDDEKGRQERQKEAAYARSITADRKKAAANKAQTNKIKKRIIKSDTETAPRLVDETVLRSGRSSAPKKVVKKSTDAKKITPDSVKAMMTKIFPKGKPDLPPIRKVPRTNQVNETKRKKLSYVPPVVKRQDWEWDKKNLGDEVAGDTRRNKQARTKEITKSYQEEHSPEGEKAYDYEVAEAKRRKNKALEKERSDASIMASDVEGAKKRHGAFSTEAGEAWMEKHFPGVKIEYDFGEYDKYKKGGSIKKGMKKKKKTTKGKKRAALRGWGAAQRGF